MLFYVDEFGDEAMTGVDETPEKAALKQGVSEWFVLGAVGIQETSRKPLAEAIFELKRRHFGRWAEEDPWECSEIKGRYLSRVSRSVAAGRVLQAPEGYKVVDTPAKVQALVTDLDLLLAKYRPLVFAVAVDKVDILQKRLTAPPSYMTAPPLGAAYAYLYQRVALTMEQLYGGDSAVLVADQQTQHERYFRSGAMNEARDALTRSLPLKPNYRLVLDKPLWIDTKLSTWDREVLQLADIVAYSVGRCVTDGQAPVHASFLWRRITALMAVHWSAGTVEGSGLSIYPKPERYPTL